MYLSWSAFYEGNTDAQYFNTLIPRVLDDVIRSHGVRPCDVAEFPSVRFGVSDRQFDCVSREICRRRDEFHIIFIHADLGGRALSQSIYDRREALIDRARDFCGFDVNTAVLLSPEKELEAWALSDPDALRSALGVTEIDEALLPDSPRAAEKLEDPKDILNQILEDASIKKRAHTQMLVRIAQEQSFTNLRRARSYVWFEESLAAALRYLGFVPAR
ncbi:hypothetical protein JMM59_14215 [Rhodovulum sulfidophilum]|nr:hypothetical protein [Rhodovulum sulfidophilum]